MRMIKHLSQCRTCEYSLQAKGKCCTTDDCQQCENSTNGRCHCCEAAKEDEIICPYYRRFENE